MVSAHRAKGKLFAALLFWMAGCEYAAGALAGDPAWVVLGPDGQAVARLITAQGCPDIVIDGRAQPMRLRAGPARIPQRPTQSAPDQSKPSLFPQRVCEADLPAGARDVRIGQHRLPRAKKIIRRIVVIGDTGCRLKAGDSSWQACNDPQRFAFAAIARAAAAWQPDLVLHVGDYLYRENRCPKDQPGCQGSPWGYGADSWQADFFTPAAPLLRAAPWVMVRGNHESCRRAGQGWWRDLDPRPLEAGRDCNLPQNDQIGDYSDSYAVPLGDRAQILVMDTSAAGKKALAADDPAARIYARNWQQILQLARRADENLLANHQPVLGFAARTSQQGQIRLLPGNAALQSVLFSGTDNPYPASVSLLLSGHVHVWEALDFTGAWPSQFIAGFSGTEEDIVPLPHRLPADAEPAPGVRVAHFSSWVDGFGFMTLQRTGKRRWLAEVHDRNGRIVNTCRIDGQHSQCRLPWLAPASGQAAEQPRSPPR